MKKITVAIVDDHKLIREMWAKLFSDRMDIEVTGESGVGEEGVRRDHGDADVPVGFHVFGRERAEAVAQPLLGNVHAGRVVDDPKHVDLGIHVLGGGEGFLSLPEPEGIWELACTTDAHDTQ